jgi:O-antigen/teichoic acid export membrane protein
MLSRLPPAALLALLTAALFGRMSTALTQIVAAIYLSPTDFGIYATGVGVMTLTTVLRGGGTGNYIQTMTPEEFRDSGGRVLRYSLLFFLFGAVVTAAIMWPVANRYAESKGYPAGLLLGTIGVLIANFGLSTLGWFARCRMVSFMRLREVSAVDACSGVVKFAATWILASEGFGPIALAAPIGIASLFENLWLWPRGGLRGTLTTRGPWLALTAYQLRFPLAVALLTTLNSQTDSLVGSIFVPVTVIGFYFFASQLASQPAQLVGSSLRAVFTSAAARVRGDATAERAGLQMLLVGSMIFMPIASMVIPAVFAPFERAVWNGRWADAYWPVFLLSATLVYPTALNMVTAPVAAARNWKLAIRLDSVRAGAKIAAAALAGTLIVWLDLGPIASGVMLAAMVGGITAVASAWELMRLMRSADISRSVYFYEMYSTPVAAVLIAVAAGSLAESLTEPLYRVISIRPAALIETTLAATLYGVLSLGLLRFGYLNALERVLDGLPDPAARFARRVLVLDPPTGG